MQPRNIYLVSLILTVIGALLLPLPIHAGAGKWAGSSNNEQWRIVRLCPQGAILDVVNVASDVAPTADQDEEDYLAEHGLSPTVVELTPRRGNSRSAGAETSGLDGAYFYPRMGPTGAITPRLQTTPYAGDEDGVNAGFYLWARAELTWTPTLAPGAEVLISQPGGLVFETPYLAGVVAESAACAGLTDHNRLPVDEADIVVDIASPTYGYEFVPDESLIFTLAQAPTAGALYTGETALAAGAQFSRTALLESPLRYHQDALAAIDTLRIQAQATYRVSGSGTNEKGSATAAAAPTMLAAGEPTISADGGTVAFTAADDQGLRQLYKVIQVNGDIRLISADPADGTPGNGHTAEPALSPDGLAVAFASEATNLTDNQLCPPAGDGQAEVLLHEFGEIQPVSLIAGGAPCVRLDGASGRPSVAGTAARRTVFESVGSANPLGVTDINQAADIFQVEPDMVTQAQSTLVVADVERTGSDGSLAPVLSADGGMLAFATDAVDLMPNRVDDNGLRDIVLRPVRGAYTESIPISVTSGGDLAVGGPSDAPAISRFGRHIAFMSEATNLGPTGDGSGRIYLHDRQVVAEGDRTQGCTLHLSTNASGDPANGPSARPSISANGRYVAYQSDADNLVPGDSNGVTDIFVIDRDADEDGHFYTDPARCIMDAYAVTRVSVASDGAQANGPSTDPTISANGDFIAFTSAADNLVPDDTNQSHDVFLHYRGFRREIRLEREIAVVYLPLVVER